MRKRDAGREGDRGGGVATGQHANERTERVWSRHNMANGSLDRLLHDVGVMVTSKVLTSLKSPNSVVEKVHLYALPEIHVFFVLMMKPEWWINYYLIKERGTNRCYM